jgi:hypothetical protein
MDHHPALWDMPKKKRAVHGLIFYFYFISEHHPGPGVLCLSYL